MITTCESWLSLSRLPQRNDDAVLQTDQQGSRLGRGYGWLRLRHTQIYSAFSAVLCVNVFNLQWTAVKVTRFSFLTESERAGAGVWRARLCSPLYYWCWWYIGVLVTCPVTQRFFVLAQLMNLMMFRRSFLQLFLKIKVTVWLFTAVCTQMTSFWVQCYCSQPVGVSHTNPHWSVLTNTQDRFND